LRCTYRMASMIKKGLYRPPLGGWADGYRAIPSAKERGWSVTPKGISKRRISWGRAGRCPGKKKERKKRRANYLQDGIVQLPDARGGLGPQKKKGVTVWDLIFFFGNQPCGQTDFHGRTSGRGKRGKWREDKTKQQTGLRGGLKNKES